MREDGPSHPLAWHLSMTEAGARLATGQKVDVDAAIAQLPEEPRLELR